MNTYFAMPYDVSAPGFYFSDFEDYQYKAANHKNAQGSLIEEYELQVIECDAYQLFDALGINQANLALWFSDFEQLDGENLVKAIYLAQHVGYGISDIMGHLDNVYMFEGSILEYAQNYIDECGLLDDMPENLQHYFDTEAFARDMLLGGDVTEIEIMGTTYIMEGG